MNVIKLTDLDVSGKRVFIRADLNVPQDAQGAITEDTRIRASVPCIQMALDAGAAVMVTSHLGRPTEGTLTPEDSLAPVAQRLGELLGRAVPAINLMEFGFAARVLVALGALTLFLAVTGLWEYSTVTYSWHMVVHMTVNMMVPVLCVGETLAEREAGQTDVVVKRQLSAVIHTLGHCISQVVVAESVRS